MGACGNRLVALVIAAAAACAGCHPREPTTARKPPESPAAPDTVEQAPLLPGYGDEIRFWLPLPSDVVSDVAGFAPMERWGRWTDGPVATIEFRRTLPVEFVLEVTAAAYGPNLGQPVAFEIGTERRSASFEHELGKGPPEVVRMRFANRSGAKRIAIRIPRPASPGRGDRRELGIALLHVRILEP